MAAMFVYIYIFFTHVAVSSGPREGFGQNGRCPLMFQLWRAAPWLLSAPNAIPPQPTATGSLPPRPSSQAPCPRPQPRAEGPAGAASRRRCESDHHGPLSFPPDARRGQGARRVPERRSFWSRHGPQLRLPNPHFCHQHVPRLVVVIWEGTVSLRGQDSRSGVIWPRTPEL